MHEVWEQQQTHKNARKIAQDQNVCQVFEEMGKASLGVHDLVGRMH